MIDPTQYLQRVEDELRRDRTISQQTCSDFSMLPLESQRAFVRALAFVGCRSANVSVSAEDVEVCESDRIVAVRLMMLSLSVDTGEPRWSSQMLERMTEGAMSTPGGRVGDIFRASFSILEGSPDGLGRLLSSFLKELVIRCFTAYRASYDAEDFSWMAESVRKHVTSAQAYLALHALPPYDLNGCREAIRVALASTPFSEEASFDEDDDEVS